MNSLNIIIKPVTTEKSTRDNAMRKYHFWVKPKSTKEEIKRAVEILYDVSVVDVNTIKYDNRKERRRGARIQKLGTNYKKAIVEIAEGQEINLA